MSIWKARERICGREILVSVDRNGKPILPDKCPKCGVSPVLVDLIERDSSGAGPDWPGAPAQLATQAAAELAGLHAIALETIKGSGKDGTITKSDVQAAIEAMASSAESGSGGEA